MSLKTAVGSILVYDEVTGKARYLVIDHHNSIPLGFIDIPQTEEEKVKAEEQYKILKEAHEEWATTASEKNIASLVRNFSGVTH